MAITKLSTGEWRLDFRVNGRSGRRIRKVFGTKGEAAAYEQYIISESERKPWVGEKKDRRRLSEIIELWYNLHGQALSASKSRMGKLRIVCSGLGDPIASEFTAKDFAHYRDLRLRGEIFNGYHENKDMWAVKPITVNRELSYLNAVFCELKRLGEWKLPNPLEGVRAFKEEDKEMSWLTKAQISELLFACEAYGKEHLTCIVKVCLATGARWSEAERLTRSQLSPFKLTFFRTKGKKIAQSPSLAGCTMSYRQGKE